MDVPKNFSLYPGLQFYLKLVVYNFLYLGVGCFLLYITLESYRSEMNQADFATTIFLWLAYSTPYLLLTYWGRFKYRKAHVSGDTISINGRSFNKEDLSFRGDPDNPEFLDFMDKQGNVYQFSSNLVNAHHLMTLMLEVHSARLQHVDQE